MHVVVSWHLTFSCGFLFFLTVFFVASPLWLEPLGPAVGLTERGTRFPDAEILALSYWFANGW